MSSLTDKWQSISPIQKVVSLLILLVLLVLPILSVYLLSKSNDTVLFSDLNPTDSAKIIQELDKLKTNYKIDSDGSRILVSEDDVHKTRLKMMGSGLSINGGVGFEIFDNVEFGMTEFAQKINYQRALQGELTRTIMALDEVKYARVHLVLPDASLFTNKKTISSAAVTLFLKPGSKIESKQVVGIQKLIASSVDKLEFNMVTISNDKGEILSKNHQLMGEAENFESQFSKKKEIEFYLLKKANTVLEAAIGADKAAVIIDVSINFDKQSKTKEEVIPNNSESDGMVRKHLSNAPSPKVKRGKNINSTVEIEYKLGKEIERLVLSPGKIDRIKVAVLLKENGHSENLDKIRDLVSMAVGLDALRGDEIYVHHVEPVSSSNDGFDGSNLQPDMDGASQSNDQRLEINWQQNDIASDTSNKVDKEYLPLIGNFTDKYGLDKTYLFTTLLLLFLLVIYLTLLSKYRRKDSYRSDGNKLTQEQRNVFLVQLKEWLNEETGLPEREQGD